MSRESTTPAHVETILLVLSFKSGYQSPWSIALSHRIRREACRFQSSHEWHIYDVLTGAVPAHKPGLGVTLGSLINFFDFVCHCAKNLQESPGLVYLMTSAVLVHIETTRTMLLRSTVEDPEHRVHTSIHKKCRGAFFCVSMVNPEVELVTQLAGRCLDTGSAPLVLQVVASQILAHYWNDGIAHVV